MSPISPSVSISTACRRCARSRCRRQTGGQPDRPRVYGVVPLDRGWRNVPPTPGAVVVAASSRPGHCGRARPASSVRQRVGARWSTTPMAAASCPAANRCSAAGLGSILQPSAMSNGRHRSSFPVAAQSLTGGVHPVDDQDAGPAPSGLGVAAALVVGRGGRRFPLRAQHRTRVGTGRARGCSVGSVVAGAELGRDPP